MERSPPAAPTRSAGSRGERPGLSANRNAGRRAAQAPIVLFTDNDTIPRPDPLRRASRLAPPPSREETAVLGHVRWAPELAVTTVHALARPRDPVRLPEHPRRRGRLGTLLRGQRLGQARASPSGWATSTRSTCPTATRTSTGPTARASSGCACSTTARAVVDHLRQMTSSSGSAGAARVAVPSAQFVRLHPDWPPGSIGCSPTPPPAAGQRPRRQAGAVGASVGCRWSARGSGTASTSPIAKRSRPTSWRRGRAGEPTAPTSRSERQRELSSAGAAARARPRPTACTRSPAPVVRGVAGRRHRQDQAQPARRRPGHVRARRRRGPPASPRRRAIHA